MRRTAALAIGLVVAAAGGAQALADDDRAAVVTLTGGVGMGASSVDQDLLPQPMGLLRLTAAGHVTPPPMPATRGHAWRGGLVPELSIATLANEEGDRDRLYLGGVRWEAGFSQREMGLLRVSARGSVWLAARAGLRRAGEASKPAGELGFGWQLYLGDSRFLVGGDLGALAWRERNDDMPDAGIAVPDGSARTAEIREGLFTGFHAGLFVGASL